MENGIICHKENHFVKNALLFVFGLCLLVLSSCKSTPKTEAGDVNGKPEIILRMPVQKKQKFVLKLCGNYDTDGKSNIMNVESVYWFDNWNNGWTEVRFSASGKLKLTGDSAVAYTVLEPVVLEFPEYVRMRIKDTYYKNETAIRNFQNRMDRMDSMLEFLHVVIKEGKTKFLNGVNYFTFESTVGCLLFPEIYGYIPGYNLKYKNVSKEEKIWGDDIFWNNKYTESFFPEYMWKVRNTGTLYRDWESNIDLFYILYFWDDFFSKDKKGILTKVKK